MEIYGTAVCFFHGPADVRQSRRQPIEHFILKGPERTLHMGVGGQGVADGAALKFSEFQQSKHRIRQFLLHFHGILVEFHGGHQCVHALSCLGNVGGFSVDVHIYLAGTGHQLLPAACHDPCFQPGPQVQTENGSDVVLSKYTAVTDILCSAGGFLCTLEHQQHVAR